MSFQERVTNTVTNNGPMKKRLDPQAVYELKVKLSKQLRVIVEETDCPEQRKRLAWEMGVPPKSIDALMETPNFWQFEFCLELIAALDIDINLI